MRKLAVPRATIEVILGALGPVSMQLRRLRQCQPNERYCGLVVNKAAVRGNACPKRGRTRAQRQRQAERGHEEQQARRAGRTGHEEVPAGSAAKSSRQSTLQLITT